jgi:hypothetical protein
MVQTPLDPDVTVPIQDPLTAQQQGLHIHSSEIPSAGTHPFLPNHIFPQPHQGYGKD